MATSGYRDVYVTKWDTLRFSWSRSSYSIPNNTSTINWSLQLISTSYGAISSSTSKAWNVNVNGTKYSGTTTVSIGNNTTKTLASGSTTIAHNNDGTKTFSYSFSQYFGITFSGSSIRTISGSSTGQLNTIPRSATITEAPDFNDETTNLTIKFNNPGNFDLKLKIEAGGDTALIVRDKVTKTSPYTFVLTDAEKNKLRQKCTKNTLTVRFTVATYIDGIESKWSYIDKTMTLINYTPTLSPTVVDQGSLSTTLTGDPDTIIRYYNTCNAVSNATARKEATISNIEITCGSKSRTSDGMLGYVDSGTFVFTVTDSRGYSASQTVTKTLIEYIPLTCNLSTNSDIVDGNTANINISVSGNYFEGSFGAVDNSLTVEYRYKTNTDNYPTDSDGNDVWTSITATVVDGKYTATTTIEGLNYANSYTFQARANDAITEYTGDVTAREQVVRIIPVFDWSENDFNFNVPVHSKGGFTYDIPVISYDANNILVSGKYYLGATSTNRPVDENGWLEVQTYTNDTNYCYQKYITYLGNKYERWRKAGTWESWMQECAQKILWDSTSGYYMHGSQSITLSEPISAQKNGIVLVFSDYNSGVTFNNLSSHFVPRSLVAYKSGAGHTFNISGRWHNGFKYLYISDNSITGFDDNSATVTIGNVTYENASFVLFRVYGI